MKITFKKSLKKKATFTVFQMIVLLNICLLANNSVINIGKYSNIYSIKTNIDIDYTLTNTKNTKITQNQLENNLKELTTNWLVVKNQNTTFDVIFNNNELVYAVLFGTFKNFETSKQLKFFHSISYEVIPSEYVRYLSEKYNTLKDAKIAKNKITVNGIKDNYKKGDVFIPLISNTIQINEDIKNRSLLPSNQNTYMNETTIDKHLSFDSLNLTSIEFTLKIDSIHLEHLQFKSTPLVYIYLLKNLVKEI